jgi:hypothetical protein
MPNTYPRRGSHTAMARYGHPECLLTDNGAVFTGRFRHLDRTHLPPSPTTNSARPVDPIEYELIMNQTATQAA